jgi:hypothetical protein
MRSERRRQDTALIEIAHTQFVADSAARHNQNAMAQID